jgi:hypothetical protein
MILTASLRQISMLQCWPQPAETLNPLVSVYRRGPCLWTRKEESSVAVEVPSATPNGIGPRLVISPLLIIASLVTSSGLAEPDCCALGRLLSLIERVDVLG